MKTDMERQAVIVVDYQKDFAKPGAPLYVQEGETLAPFINSLVRNVKLRSGILIATRDFHPENTVHFEAWPRHCEAGKEGSEYMDGFDTKEIDVEIFKGFGNANDGYSGFEGVTKLVWDPQKGFEKAQDAETLKEVLQRCNVKVVQIVGLATDYCVKATALGAIKEWFEVYVYDEGIRAVNINPLDGANAISEMEEAGVKIVTDCFSYLNNK